MMFHFLEKKARGAVNTEYVLRLSMFALLFATSAIVTSIALFLPSYFFVSAKHATIANQLTEVNATVKSAVTNPLAEIGNINATVAALARPADTFDPSSILAAVADVRTPGITITRFVLSGASNASISGVASTRAALTDFAAAMKGDGRFTNVVLPVSALIPETDNGFTITFSAH